MSKSLEKKLVLRKTVGGADAGTEEMSADTFGRLLKDGKIVPSDPDKPLTVQELHDFRDRPDVPKLTYTPESVLQWWRESPSVARDFLSRVRIPDPITEDDLRIIDTYLGMRVRTGKGVECHPPRPLRLHTYWRGSLDALGRPNDPDVRERLENMVGIARALSKIGVEVGGVDLAALITLLHGRVDMNSYRSQLQWSRRKRIFSSGSLQLAERCFRMANLGGQNRQVYEHVEAVVQGVGKAVPFAEIQDGLGQDAMARIGETDPNEYRSLLNRSCQILECIGRVHKLPYNSRFPGAPTMWIHRDYRQTAESIPHWNGKFRIMEVLLAQPDSNRDAIISHSLMDDFRVSMSGTWGDIVSFNMGSALDDLRYEGMVTVDKKSPQETVRRVNHYSLTDDARELVQGTIDQGFLGQELCDVLLGNLLFGITPTQRDTLRALRVYLAVFMERDKAVVEGGRTGFGAKAIATKLAGKGIQVPWGSVKQYIEGANPLVRHSPDLVQSTFISRLSDDEVDQLRKMHPKYFVKK